MGVLVTEARHTSSTHKPGTAAAADRADEHRSRAMAALGHARRLDAPYTRVALIEALLAIDSRIDLLANVFALPIEVKQR
jgi:hypothetical protein